MADLNDLLVSAISAFQEAWVRPGQQLASADPLPDPAASRRRWTLLVKWDKERDRWMWNLHSLIQTALQYPDDAPDVDLDAHPEALPSWRQAIEGFITNCRASAESIEMAWPTSTTTPISATRNRDENRNLIGT